MDEFKKYFQDYRADLDMDLPDDRLWNEVKKELHPKAVFSMQKRWIAAACIIAAVGVTVFFYNNKGTTQLAAGTDRRTDSINMLQPNDMIALVQNGVKQLSVLPTLKNHLEKRSASEKFRQMVPVTVVGYKEEKQIAVAKNRKHSTKKIKPAYGFEGIEASYAAMLDVQLEKVRTQPIYGESADYFDLFKVQLNKLDQEEKEVKKGFSKAEDKEIKLNELITIYQQKIAVLKQLQFEINKMNNKVKQTDTGIPMLEPSYINL